MSCTLTKSDSTNLMEGLEMRSSVFLVGLFLVAAGANAETYSVGERILPFSLEDQNGTSQAVDESTALILFSRDMDGGKLLKAALEGVPAEFLPTLRAAYVSDISEMPSLVARMFALPSMRKRPYPILLDRLGQTTRRLPDIEGQATLIVLKRLEIMRVDHADSANAVRKILGLEPLPTPE